MAMEQLLRMLLTIPEVSALVRAVERGGVPRRRHRAGPVHRAQAAAALALETGRPLVMVCADEGSGGRLGEDLRNLTGEGAAEALRPGALCQGGHRHLPPVGARGSPPSTPSPRAGAGWW